MAKRKRSPEQPTALIDQPDDDHATGACVFCGKDAIDILDDAYMLARGAFMFSTDRGEMIFKLDPDTDLTVIQLADGSLALRAPETKRGPTRYAHTECTHDVAYNVGAPFIDPEDEDRYNGDAPPELTP
jgi:hypothetical protein